MHRVLCLNGPNLDLLGTREPGVYGSLTLGDLEDRVSTWGTDLGLEVECFQTNDEGALVDAIHGSTDYDGVVLNPGALTHMSLSLRDAIAAVSTPVVEVHLSNVRHRDRWRRRSVVADAAVATIFGRGADGYRAALRHLINRAACTVETLRYGPHPDHVFDLRPADGPVTAVLVHGGFWLDAWGRDTTESWAVDLSRRGVASANLEYRRLGSGGGVVPTVADVTEGLAAAAEALPSSPPVVIGHSAGAHLALAAASRLPDAIGALVLVAGVFDPTAPGLDPTGADAARRFDPEATTSLDRLSRPRCPVLVVHGSEDRVVPPDQSNAVVEVLGSAADLAICEGEGHFEALTADSEIWKQVTEWMQART